MAKRRPFKPAVDTICDLRAFQVGKPWTPAEFRFNALSPWMYNKPSEASGIIKWAKRYGLIKPVPGGKYVLTPKGDRVAKKACHR